jgi:putative FmdB family regulatory protein
MPIHEFVCLGCQAEFELLIRGNEKTACPECGHAKLEKQLSIISTPAAGGKSQPQAESCAMPRCCGGGCQPM